MDLSTRWVPGGPGHPRPSFWEVLGILCLRSAESRVILLLMLSPLMFFGGSGSPPDLQKPSKTLYCRQFSRVRQIGKSDPPRPLLGASGVTFSLISGTLGLPGCSWVPLGRPPGAKSRKKKRKLAVCHLPRRPGRPKRRPRAPKTSKMKPRGSKNDTKIFENQRAGLHVTKSCRNRLPAFVACIGCPKFV